MCMVCSGDSLVVWHSWFILLKPSERSVFATVCVYDFHLEEQSVMRALSLFSSRVLFVMGQADFVVLTASCRHVLSTHWTTLL